MPTWNNFVKYPPLFTGKLEFLSEIESFKYRKLKKKMIIGVPIFIEFCAQLLIKIKKKLFRTLIPK